jgi:hypothetical protein
MTLGSETIRAPFRRSFFLAGVRVFLFGREGSLSLGNSFTDLRFRQEKPRRSGAWIAWHELSLSFRVRYPPSLHAPCNNAEEATSDCYREVNNEPLAGGRT